MEPLTKKGRINSLEGIRAIALLGVMFNHTGLAKGYFNLTGHWSVSVFFILSGFVAVYCQMEFSDFEPSFSYNFKYLVKRMKKLYPLYLLTLLALLIFEFVGSKRTPLANILLRLGMNLLLVEEWIPLNKRGINGVSWYLCTYAFFFFLFPYVLKRFQKGFTKKKAYVFLSVCILFEILIACASSYLPRPVYSQDMALTYDFVYWFTYRFPLCRIFDCFIGCCLGYVFLQNKDKKIYRATCKELLAVILCIISIVIASLVRPITPVDSEIPIIDYSIGWSYSLGFLPCTIYILYIFAFGQGKISDFFSNKFFMYLARISAYCVLIHYVVFEYLVKVVYFVVGDEDAVRDFLNQYGGWLKVTVGVFLSLAATQIWIWFVRICQKRRKESVAQNHE